MDRESHSVQNNSPTINVDDENHLGVYHNRYVGLWGENSDNLIKLSTLILKNPSPWWPKGCSSILKYGCTSILKGDTWTIFKTSVIDTVLEEKATE